MHIVAMRKRGYLCEKTEIMMTREEIAAIDRECEEQHISQQAHRRLPRGGADGRI